jgi:hypothetical protein
MPQYRIYRMKDGARQQFRWAPHTIGITSVKAKDYDMVNTVDAANAYGAWLTLKDTQAALQVGDILEAEGGELRIYKYVGFEEAQWYVPEPKLGPEGAVVSGNESTAAAP